MRYKIITIAILSVTGLVLSAGNADASILSLMPTEDTISVGDTVIVDVYLNSEKAIVNASDAVIHYPTDMLEVVTVEHSESVFTLWPVEPNDNGNGTITYTGGIPNGSYIFDAKVMSVTFQALKVGRADIKFIEKDTSVRLNNSAGMRTPLTVKGTTLNVTQQSITAVDLRSPTHPEEHIWYPTSTFTVQWDPRSGAFYSYIITQTLGMEPDNIQEFDPGEATFEDLTDGIHTFILSEKNPNEEWQIVARRTVKVDATSPLPLDVELVENASDFDDKTILTFATTDATSGIDRYDIEEGATLYSDVSSPHILVDQDYTETITITAYDLAGNSIEARISPPGESEISTTAGVIYIIAVTIVIVLMFILLNRVRKRYIKTPRRETKDHP